MDLGLKGRTAFVAGASRGLGAATARQLASEGANVAINGRNGERLTATADAIRQETGAAVLPAASAAPRLPQTPLKASERPRTLACAITIEVPTG